MPVATLQAAGEKVLNFLQQQNRPYNAQGVTDHLAQFGVKKAQAQKALDALSDAGKIKCKVRHRSSTENCSFDRVGEKGEANMHCALYL